MHHHHSPLERIVADDKFLCSSLFMQPVIQYQSYQIYHKKNISEEKDFQIFFDALVVSPITYQAKEYNDEYKVHE